MKVALLLVACATLAAAAATEPFQATENMSFPQDVSFPEDVSINSSAVSSATQACGGLTPAQCRNICGRLGFRCWRCTPNACQCSNSC